MDVRPGSLWCETGQGCQAKDAGRVIRVISNTGSGPAFEYIDQPSGPSNWHYCDIMDFVLWNRFERL